MSKLDFLVIVIPICFLFYSPSMILKGRQEIKQKFQQKIVAEVIAAEACGEGERGMIAVANTIANRAFQKKMTPYEIVIMPHQYLGHTALQRELRYRECGAVADYLAEHIMDLEDITGGAIYFKRPEEKKKPWHKILTVKIGHHQFYR